MRFVLLLSALLISGCVSTHMKRFIGKDVRYVSLDNGQEPEHVEDMPDGRRAFQFRWAGGAMVVPATTTVNGQARLEGNSVYYSEQRLESGGGVVLVNPGCVITYFARWNEAANGWVVVDISYPKKAVC
jgi:hypothetical protein